MSSEKPYQIPKRLVWGAYLRVKANRGAAGVDGESLAMFETDLKNQLYKIWNRMSSGSYFPPPVRLVEIEKKDGGRRPLGIPTVADRVAQTVVKMIFEPVVEPVFHPDSYGYRPGKSAHHAVAKARQRCFQFDWVIDLDIKGFFDSIPHDLVERAVAKHTDVAWVALYVGRWLRAPLQHPDGTVVARTTGTPQGGVISPLLANLFLHYAFDAWMQQRHPSVPFERYADDVIVHCRSKEEAESVLRAIAERFTACGLVLHPTKTRIVYCKDDNRPGKSEHVQFDFLSFTFRARPARGRQGRVFFGFVPAISRRAVQAIREKIRSWRLTSKTHLHWGDLAALLDPRVRGWWTYFGRFYASAARRALQSVNQAIVWWVRRKYKRVHQTWRAAVRWTARLARRVPVLLELWRLGVLPDGWSGRAG